MKELRCTYCRAPATYLIYFTKRQKAHRGRVCGSCARGRMMEWVDSNDGSKITVKRIEAVTSAP